MGTGLSYEWDLPKDHTWSKCLVPVGEGFDDGRYRQTSYEAVQPDCVDKLVRTSMFIPLPPAKPAQLEVTFTVWYDGEPAHDGTMIPLDVNAEGNLPLVEVNAGAFITLRASEKDTFPLGFPWVEPAADTEFKCIDIKNINLGNLKTTYRQWLVQTKITGALCEETVMLQRPEWWTGSVKEHAL